jgi:uncharacterized protein YcgL (UPF0745 family)
MKDLRLNKPQRQIYYVDYMYKLLRAGKLLRFSSVPDKFVEIFGKLTVALQHPCNNRQAHINEMEQEALMHG